MSKLQIVVNDKSKTLAVKEYQGKRVVTFSEIDHLHERALGTARRNFNQNKDRFIEGEDFFSLHPSNPDVRNSHIRSFVNNAGTIFITESGYLMLVKSFQDDLAWVVQRQLVNSYFRAKVDSVNVSQLSPELQMFSNLFNSMAKQELENKQMKKEIKETKQEVADVRNIFTINPKSWRKEVNDLIIMISKTRNNLNAYRDVRNESYQRLEDRARCDLDIRLQNMRDRMRKAGASVSAINRKNKMDVIESDTRLMEIYLTVVKEMAIKNNVKPKPKVVV